MAELVEPESDRDDDYGEATNSLDEQLVAWVMSRVDKWKDVRDSSFKALWSEYYRLWRGRWVEEDRTRNSERSRIVTPALSQALEMTVAELEEATFGREQWIDVLDDAGDPDHTDTLGYRRKLLDDLARDKVPGAISQSFLTGGLYGTMAAKLDILEDEDKVIMPPKMDETGNPLPSDEPRVETFPRVKVAIVPIPPNELVVDPEASSIEESMGAAHDVVKPKSFLLQYSWGKEYAGKPATAEADTNRFDQSDLEAGVTMNEHSCRITEWHGLVPARMLADATGDAMVAEMARTADPDEDMETLVEAIVTIADGCKVLRKLKNPFLMGDRSIVACPYERVPGRFWGRGVMEKGYNPQKALDAEIRMRSDVMALIGNPMFGVDATALPRGFDMRLRPGKLWLTNGSPKDALHPIAFQGLDPASFSHTAELERMVQMGTGAMDTATPLDGNRRNETATGTSLIAGTFVKRSKRALANITRDFIEPLIQKYVWRRLQYDPARYTGAFNFRVTSTLGIVAREMEQAQMINLMGLVPQGSKPQMVLVKAIFDNTSSPYKAELLQAIDEMFQPDPQAQEMAQMAQQLQMAGMVAELEKIKAETADKLASADLKRAQILTEIAKMQAEGEKVGVDKAQLEIEVGKLMVQLRELDEYRRQIDVSAIKAQADLIKAKNMGNKSNGSGSSK